MTDENITAWKLTYTSNKEELQKEIQTLKDENERLREVIRGQIRLDRINLKEIRKEFG